MRDTPRSSVAHAAAVPTVAPSQSAVHAMELIEGEALRGHLARLWTRPHDDQSAVRPRGASPLPAAEDAGAQSFTASAALSAVTASGEVTAPREPPRLVETGVEPKDVSAEALTAVLPVIGGLCVPLAFLHGEGIVHRDLKPDNVLIRADGRPMLVDFGIATSWSGALGREEIVVEESVGGSVAYMAPEQIRGEFADARADLYALGCILFECLTGRTPFVGDAASILYQHLNEPPVPPSYLAHRVPPELDLLVLRLLAKQPHDRLGHAHDVAKALAALGVPWLEPDDASRAKAYLYRPSLAGRGSVLSALEHGLGRWRDAVEVNATRAIGGEDSVGENGVKMKIKVEAAAEPLRVVDRCVPAAGDAGGSFLLERDRFDEDAAERTGDVGAERGKAAKLERERENPLSHRHRREDAVDDVGGGVGHATPGAARVDASTLAREGDEKIPVTRVAMETEQSVGEHAAREVGTEGLLDVARQSALVALTGVGEECFEVVAHDRVEDRLRRPTRSVACLGEPGPGAALLPAMRRATGRLPCHMPPE